MKKNQIIIAGIVILVLVVGLPVGYVLTRPAEAEPEPITEERKLITAPVNIIDVDQRPYMTLVPRNDGREIALEVVSLNKPADEVEFELEYSAGDMLQGAFGSIDLSGGAGEYKVLLGSCSAGGACSYHENVTGGKATLNFSGDEAYAVLFYWRFQAAAQAQGKYGTQDQKFQLEGENIFPRSAYVIVAETSGPPAAVEGEILAGPYGVFPSNGIAVTDEATVNIRLNEAVEAATILGWDGADWVELETSVDGRVVSTTGQVYDTYIVLSN